MKINVLNLCNAVDALLRKVEGKKWEDADFSSIVAKVKRGDNRGRVSSFGATFEARLAAAVEKGDSFAVALRDALNAWQNLQRAGKELRPFPLFFLVEARNDVAHRGVVDSARLRYAAEYYPELELDAAGFFELPAALDCVTPILETVDNNAAEIVKAFIAIEAAVRVKHGVLGSASIAQALVAGAAAGMDGIGGAEGAKKLAGRAIASFWKLNNIRNRYIHTGKIRKADSAFVARFAAKYGVEF